MMRLISDNYESEYIQEVENLTMWYADNNLVLNWTTKRTTHTVHINTEAVVRVFSFRLLGVTITTLELTTPQQFITAHLFSVETKEASFRKSVWSTFTDSPLRAS